MSSVCLAHWNALEGHQLAEELAAKGFSVAFHPVDAGKLMGILKKDPPAAVVIDLNRSPAQGRDLAVGLRIAGPTRRVPLVFAEGDPEKVARIRELLPDATFTSWREIEGALRKALAHPPEDPVVPGSALAGYSGTPLPKKLGIKGESVVLLVRAPGSLSETLGELPSDARLVVRYSAAVDLILWFVRTGQELEEGIVRWSDRVGAGGLWILWAKKGSDAHTGLTQGLVRKVGLANGLVDYKIASLDETWSGLKFASRKGGKKAGSRS